MNYYLKQIFKLKMIGTTVVLFFAFGLWTLNATVLPENQKESQQGITITGTVTDDTGGSLPGVNVVVKGTNIGVVADVNGKYSITIPGRDAVLVFSFIGFATQEFAVGDRTNISVTLSEGVAQIEEVVVVGFGTQKKVNLTGAITAVGSEVFENRPVANIGQALQGIVPNLNITVSNGAPNTVPNLNIRGGTTIEQDPNNGDHWTVYRNAPLILVDGVEYSATMLNQMNPNDIENMSVIKDASAAAIYGTKASFGVILIQTKSGKFGQKGRVTYTYDLSLDSPSAIPDILDAYTIQRATVDRRLWTTANAVETAQEQRRLEAIRKYLDDPRPENAWYTETTDPLASSIQWVANVNPFDLVLKTITSTHKHNLSLSGGTDRMAYYASLGYHNQDGLYKIGEDQYQRYNAALRVNAKVKDWFNVEARLNYNRTQYEAPYLVGGKGTLWSAMKNETNRNINMPLMTGTNDPIPNTYTDNILSWVSYGARTFNTSTTAALSISPEFIIVPEMLKAKADLSFTPQTTVENRRSPRHAYVSDSWISTRSEQAEAQEHRGRLYRSNTDTYLINTYLDFNHTFAGIHFVSAIAGFSQESVTFGSTALNLRGLFSPDIQKPSAADDPSLHTNEVGGFRRTGRGVFGRINYILLDRYLFEVNGRYDGSSRFTPNERYFFFPSFSAGWIVTQEDFMDFSRGWLDHLKIKASWGKLGSQPSGNYPYQETLASGTASYFIDGNWSTYVGAPRLVSPALTWQKAATTNVGVEINVLRNRLQFEYNKYRRKVTDILLAGEVQYPSTLGVSDANLPLINSGRMDAYGWELELRWRDRLRNGISYKVSAVLSDERTKVMEFTGNSTKMLTSSRGNLLYEGMIVGNIWGYETGGILQESDLRPNPATPGAWLFDGPQGSTRPAVWPGQIWLRDLDGSGVIDEGDNTLDNPGDRKILGNNMPRYNYGFTADISWKGFDFNVFVQGVGKRDIWTGNSSYWGGNAGSRWMYDRSWTPERTNAKFPMYGAAPATQSAFMINGAYLRVKQAVLGYTLPQELTGRIGIERLRFSIAGFNLLDITDIPKVFDPDQISDAYPQRRTFSFGAQITF